MPRSFLDRVGAATFTLGSNSTVMKIYVGFTLFLAGGNRQSPRVGSVLRLLGIPV
ncbi:hypothetical protein [Rubrivirga sp.]|uniref:hypothetical protein n=1 Tax=Rubrivirga sp. TaxID=1885344 RepID=UPI003B52AC26